MSPESDSDTIWEACGIDYDGYDSLRVLTYSASISAIVRMLDQYAFGEFGCVFGCEGTLHDFKDILAFQKVVVGDTRAAIMGLKDDRHRHVLEQVRAGQARFRVLRKHVAHAKLYLLSNAEGHTRVIIGSANLSERAFSGNQPETLVKFDDDERAWRHYTRMLDEIRDSASDEIPLDRDIIANAEIEIDVRLRAHAGQAELHHVSASRPAAGVQAVPGGI